MAGEKVYCIDKKGNSHPSSMRSMLLVSIPSTCSDRQHILKVLQLIGLLLHDLLGAVAILHWSAQLQIHTHSRMSAKFESYVIQKLTGQYDLPNMTKLLSLIVLSTISLAEETMAGD